MPAKYLADLNPQQRFAVEHGVTGERKNDVTPLLVIAGAGSGKTNTLSHRVAHLIVNGIDAHRILLLTFSRRAAEEMKRRVERITAEALATKQIDLPWSGTFHGIGARLLREFAGQIGLDPSFTILDRSDAADQMNLVRHELGYSKTEERFPTKDTCLSIYSLAVNSEEPLDRVLAKFFPWCEDWKPQLRKLFREYVAAKKRQNVLDYDDLLLYWAEMMNEEGIASEISARFDHVLIDEYQDTNSLQESILLRLKPSGVGLMVVGDDAQSIYSFRAATVRNILDFPKRFETSARIVLLEQNYRSTQPILKACNKVIGLSEEQFAKNLFSEKESRQRPTLTTVADEGAQARYVAKGILEAREEGLPLKSQAVLFRASHHSALLEIELARRNIPFRKFGGLKFLEAAHVKDMIAVFRWCDNPKDRLAGFRILQLLPGIGPGIASKALDAAAGSMHPVDSLADFQPPKAAVEDWPKLVRVLRKLHADEKGWPAEFDLVRKWYEPHLQRQYDDARLRADDLAQLAQIAAGYHSREKFLTELTLDPPNATSGRPDAPLLDEDYVTLSTIHSAKGQEWRSVRILNVVDGCIPSDLAAGSKEEIEEERRLLYVAMTRAMDQLDLIVPLRFFTLNQARGGDRHVYASVSRFIPQSIRKFFDVTRWSENSVDEDKALKKRGPRIDLTKRLVRKWG